MRASRLALIVAKRWHGKQRYGDGTYLDNHLLKVAKIVEDMGGSDLDIAVALLHDLIEDTLFPPETLRAIFPTYVSRLVLTMTRRDGESYADYMDRILEDPRACFIKFADSTANLSACLAEAEAEKAEGGSVSRLTSNRIKKYRNNIKLTSRVIGVDPTVLLV